MTRRNWVLPLTLVLAVAAGVWAGFELGRVRTDQGPEAQRNAAGAAEHEPPAGFPQIRPVEHDKALLDLLRRQVAIYSYKGDRHLEFWIEQDLDGTKKEVCRFDTRHRSADKPRGPVVQGRLTWIRYPAAEDGTQEWEFAVAQGPTEAVPTKTVDPNDPNSSWGERLTTSTVRAKVQLQPVPNLNWFQSFGNRHERITEEGESCLHVLESKGENEQGEVVSTVTFKLFCRIAPPK